MSRIRLAGMGLGAVLAVGGLASCGEVSTPRTLGDIPQARPVEPKRYVCHKTATPIKVDGRGDDAAWKNASWTDWFIDIEGDRRSRPYYRTRVKMCWDDQYIYFLAELEEPHVWGTLTQRNSIIFQDNDFEIFIDPDGDRLNYYEFEINALGTVLELSLNKPYIDKGSYTFVTMEGIHTAVHVRGTVNDPTDRDEGWSVEVAIPFKGLGDIAGGMSGPPRVGEVWKVNFSRVQWRHEVVVGKYVKVPKEVKVEENWVWSEMGMIDMHRPERWGVVEFAS